MVKMILLSSFILMLFMMFMFLFNKKMKNIFSSVLFECGFSALGSTRSPLSNRFFLLILVFLLFDVEIGIFLSYLVIFFKIYSFVLMNGFIFLFGLLYGLIFEWNEGSLSWGY